jgi:MraZ protein
MAFRGTFDYSLDQKNRLTVPAKFRAAVGESVVLATGTDGCVEVWRPADFDEQIAGALAGRNPLSKEARQIRQWFFGNSHEVELDSAGRVAMPAALIGHASIEKEVHVTGAGDHFQVWDRSRWASHKADLGAKIDDIIESLGHPA